jgi:hypothetical protein
VNVGNSASSASSALASSAAFSRLSSSKWRDIAGNKGSGAALPGTSLLSASSARPGQRPATAPSTTSATSAVLGKGFGVVGVVSAAEQERRDLQLAMQLSQEDQGLFRRVPGT